MTASPSSVTGRGIHGDVKNKQGGVMCLPADGASQQSSLAHVTCYHTLHSQQVGVDLKIDGVTVILCSHLPNRELMRTSPIDTHSTQRKNYTHIQHEQF